MKIININLDDIGIQLLDKVIQSIYSINLNNEELNILINSLPTDIQDIDWCLYDPISTQPLYKYFKNKHIIRCYTDYSCNMEAICLDDKCIGEGNFWDFHNGGAGSDEYGDYDNSAEYIKNICIHFGKKNENVILIKTNYKYE